MVMAGLTAFLLINLGYVYKTSCPLASGGKQTSWTWTINDILPYIRKTEPPCEAHTATRLLVSVIGIAPLGSGDRKATADAMPSKADQRAADSLRYATAGITSEYVRERSLTSSITASGVARKERLRRLFALVRAGVTRFQGIKTRLDQPVPGATDADLVEARRLLSRWLGIQIEADEALFSSSTLDEWRKKGERILRGVLPVVARLETLSASIQVKYPEVNSWAFLRNRNQ